MKRWPVTNWMIDEVREDGTVLLLIPGRCVYALSKDSAREIGEMLLEATGSEAELTHLRRFALSITPDLLDSMEERRATSAGNVSSLRSLRKRALEAP
jgi:hypothetical protein